MSMSSPPQHLDKRAKVVWRELARTKILEEDCDRIVAEALCVQIVRMRDARDRVDAEGEVIAGARERAEPHPALVIERAAGQEVRRWLAVIREQSVRPVAAEPRTPFEAFDELAAKRVGGGS